MSTIVHLNTVLFHAVMTKGIYVFLISFPLCCHPKFGFTFSYTAVTLTVRAISFSFSFSVRPLFLFVPFSHLSPSPVTEVV